MAFQSIKKLLPPSCKCMEGEMLEKLIAGMLYPRDINLPSGYLAFARKIAAELFPVGWDRSYRSHVTSTGPSLSSCFAVPRSWGGGSTISMGQDEFLQKAFGSTDFELEHKCEPLVVQSAGKPRPLTKYPAETLLLKPLHKAMYDRLSELPWCLRGDLTADALDLAGFKKGRGALVSGDYKSATDNLPLVVAEAILDVALENATRVPESVRVNARALLRPAVVEMTLCGPMDCGTVVAGQQMGSLLSFPLLCAQNYTAFRWALWSFRPDGFQRYLIGDVPVLINGDDILFQVCDPRFFRAWVSTVRLVGLEVELSKTSFEDDFGSLNSTLLRWRGAYLRVVRTVRMGMLRSSDFVNSLSSNFRNFVSGLGSRSYEAAWQFFSWHRPAILRAGRTLRRLGFSGALAWRVANKMGLQRVPLRDGFGNRALPPAPTFHNFVLTREEVEYVPSTYVDQGGLEDSVREMISWKWSLCGSYDRRGSALSYLAALSQPGLSWSSLSFFEHRFPGSRLSQLPRMEIEKIAYFSARPSRVKCLPFIRKVERLPAYAEVVGDALESGPTLCQYGLHRLRLAGDKEALKQWHG